MYSRQEASQLRQEFWTVFGQYLLPLPSSEGEKVNWVNYKTGEKDIAFRMHADNRTARIAIELTHRDPGIRQLYYEQLLQLRALLQAHLGEEWTWQPETTDDNGRTLSRVSQELQGVSIFKKEDWPRLISFFKARILSLDAFWNDSKYAFEALR